MLPISGSGRVRLPFRIPRPVPSSAAPAGAKCASRRACRRHVQSDKDFHCRCPFHFIASRKRSPRERLRHARWHMPRGAGTATPDRQPSRLPARTAAGANRRPITASVFLNRSIMGLVRKLLGVTKVQQTKPERCWKCVRNPVRPDKKALDLDPCTLILAAVNMSKREMTMTYQDCLSDAVDKLLAARLLIDGEIRSYPTPISGCDAQFNHLIGMRNSITQALKILEEPQFVATPRELEPSTKAS